jgi:deoxyribose-phosphate aldolase
MNTETSHTNTTNDPAAAKRRLVSMVDHTLLSPTATREDVTRLCEEAVALGVFAVCVSPVHVAQARLELPEEILVATVCGFPSGKHAAAVKAYEASCAVAEGAAEVDMVIDVGAALEGRFDDVEAEIAAVVAACGEVPVKVIIESAALPDTAIVGCCEAAERAGAAFVKTSTGFHPAGGATVSAVTLMATVVGGRLGVKASGGIRTREAAEAMIDAGATRLGLSSTRAVLEGYEAPSEY